jgi:hypothetical protein
MTAYSVDLRQKIIDEIIDASENELRSQRQLVG